MFLSEVALGKERTITKDDCSLKKAPAGFDSVVARGSVEPGTNPKMNWRATGFLCLSRKAQDYFGFAQ